MIVCDNCGNKNPEGYNFCDQCFSPIYPSDLFEPIYDRKGNNFFDLNEGYEFAKRYIIKRKIGRTGGIGSTYLANDTQKDGALVSLKVIRTGLITSKKIYKKLENLFNKLNSLQNEALANVIDYGIYEKIYYAVFQYIKGEDLIKILEKRESGFKNRELTTIFMQLVEVLDFAHSNDLVHGALSPFNVIYSEKEKKIGIIDFGLVDILTSERRSLLKEDGALGMSLFYTAPEILRGGKSTRYTDLYSIGAIMYEISCNYLPFKSHSSYRLVTYVLNKTPKRPSLINPDLPLYITDPIMKLLSKDPRDRYSSAKELLEVLKRSSKKELYSRLLWVVAIGFEVALLTYIIMLLIR